MTNYFKVMYKDPSRNLNNITRYSGVFCIKPESDGYHVIDMMAICMKIREFVKEETGYLLDKKDLIYRCYIHDFDENLAGDIQRSIKYHNESIRSAVAYTVDSLMRSVYDEELIHDIETSKDISTYEGLIVKLADTMQASFKIYEEYKLGNFHFESFIKEHSGFLQDLESVVEKSPLYTQSKESNEILLVLKRIIADFSKTIKSEVNRIKN